MRVPCDLFKNNYLHMKLENKRIVITGATSGIGLHLTKTLAEIKGTQIIAVGRKS